MVVTGAKSEEQVCRASCATRSSAKYGLTKGSRLPVEQITHAHSPQLRGPSYVAGAAGSPQIRAYHPEAGLSRPLHGLQDPKHGACPPRLPAMRPAHTMHARRGAMSVHAVCTRATLRLRPHRGGLSARLGLVT